MTGRIQDGGRANASDPIKKLYYSISEVSDMLGVKPHVLRYWESQFERSVPRRAGPATGCIASDVELPPADSGSAPRAPLHDCRARREIGRLRNAGSSFPQTASDGGKRVDRYPAAPELPATAVPSVSRATTRTEERDGLPDRGAPPLPTHAEPVTDGCR
ncbi:MAG: MerR family transcriptional regulator [Candidatus Eisenbacteria bacterium]